MPDWYTPDERWALSSGVTTRAEYAERWVVRGYFHAGVPKEVRLAYEPAEHLLALAWYHWPLYDVGLRQVLGGVEMAVRFRAQELGIETQTNNSKGKPRDKALASLIAQLVKAEPGKYEQEWLGAARNLRNHYAHPKEHSYMGWLGRHKAIVVLNLINLLFLAAETVEAEKRQVGLWKKTFASRMEEVSVLKYLQKAFLTVGADPLVAWRRGDTWWSVWRFLPIPRETLQAYSAGKYIAPFILLLRDLSETEHGGFAATEVSTDTTIELQLTIQVEHRAVLDRHYQEWEQLEDFARAGFTLQLRSKSLHQSQKLLHRYRWSI